VDEWVVCEVLILTMSLALGLGLTLVCGSRVSLGVSAVNLTAHQPAQFSMTSSSTMETHKST
jgi:hypothetical protein